HACTGNSAYRAEALRTVGLFDETFGYGYDNDVSYRLREAGYRLTFCRAAESVHRWREGLLGYLAQQYGFGYGRIDLVAKHPKRVTGDSVSPAGMMMHPLVMGIAIAGLVSAALAAAADGPWRPIALGAATLLLPQTFPIVPPHCASPPSVRRRTFTTGCPCATRTSPKPPGLGRFGRHVSSA